MSTYPLLFRRQYLFGPKIDGFASWTKINSPDNNILVVHPDLEVIKIHEGQFTLILLGYLLDPEDIRATNKEVLISLANKSQNIDDLLVTLDNIGGRYVLFVYTADRMVVLNDAGGLRQVYFHRGEDGSMWLAAQPGLLAEKLGFSYSEEVIDFLKTETIQKYQEPWFPGTSTPYAEIKHLLPNHLLDLHTGIVERFWPREKIKKYTVKQGTEKAALTLQNLMKAANIRFDLALGLTGGYDSRIILAACKDIIQELHVFSMIYHRLTSRSSDIVVANKLAQYAGVPHHVFACDKPMDEDFSYLYTHNIDKVYQSYGNIVYGRFINLEQTMTVVKSVTNEIARCFYYRTGVYPYKITPDLLCRVSKLGTHPFVYKNFADWMNDAKPVAEKDYKLLDFFYWENRNASWQAMSQLEFDLAHEEYTPFGHRNLLATMLGVDHKYRCMPKNIFQRELVRLLWSGLDDFPYNPNSKIIKKPIYEGPWMNLGRWIKYNIIRK